MKRCFTCKRPITAKHKGEKIFGVWYHRPVCPSGAERSEVAPTPQTLDSVSGSASLMRMNHLIKGMRYWLNRADDKLNRGYVSHGKIAVGKASEALDQLELETLRG